MAAETIQVGSHRIAIGNLDAYLFSKDRITKGDLITYYGSMASFMLPHMRNRMLSMQRFPKGIDEEWFFQKDAPDYFPRWIKRIAVRKKDDALIHYVVCNNAATLVYLANHACITMHIGLNKIDKLQYPDRIIFDLDPSDQKDFASVKWAAFELKKVLEAVQLVPFVMTTGGKGVHVVVPIKRTYEFDAVRDFSFGCAQVLVDHFPNELTLEIRKEKRGNKIFVDTLRNAFGQTGVAPYCVRAHDGAPIAMPITWDQLKTVKHARQFTMRTMMKQIKTFKDPWHDINKYARAIKIS